jgi:hypothetical protein
LGELCLFFFLFEQILDFSVETVLNGLDSLFVFFFLFFEHFFVHGNLFIESLLNSFLFHFKFDKPVLKDAVESLSLSEFTGAFLNLFLIADFFVEDIISKFAGSVGKMGKGSFSIFLRGEVFQCK